MGWLTDEDEEKVTGDERMGDLTTRDARRFDVVLFVGYP